MRFPIYYFIVLDDYYEADIFIPYSPAETFVLRRKPTVLNAVAEPAFTTFGGKNENCMHMVGDSIGTLFCFK